MNITVYITILHNMTTSMECLDIINLINIFKSTVYQCYNDQLSVFVSSTKRMYTLYISPSGNYPIITRFRMFSWQTHSPNVLVKFKWLRQFNEWNVIYRSNIVVLRVSEYSFHCSRLRFDFRLCFIMFSRHNCPFDGMSIAKISFFHKF